MTRLINDTDEIEKILRADSAFTEAVYRDDKGVYLLGGDNTRRYITQLMAGENVGGLTDDDFKVITAMQKYGGSFVKALADLCLVADGRNLSRIKSTWAGYWDQYTKMAKEKL